MGAKYRLTAAALSASSPDHAAKYAAASDRASFCAAARSSLDGSPAGGAAVSVAAAGVGAGLCAVGPMSLAPFRTSTWRWLSIEQFESRDKKLWPKSN